MKSIRKLIRRPTLSLVRLFSSTHTNHSSSASASAQVTPKLNAAQSALAHRLGIQAMPAEKFSLALSHPSLNPSQSQDESLFLAFRSLRDTGRAVLDYFVAEYVQARFPRLPRDSRRLSMAVYTCEKNLAAVGRAFGLEYGLVRFQGLPLYCMPSMG